MIELMVPVSLADVLEALTSAPEEDVIQFVKDLDLIRGEWEFTEKLYQHFKAEHKAFKAECKHYKQMAKE